uniref:response regulator transcription factor n=1 Tax=Paenibacillus selenitireducens TaxID=1324314 RepID=UPI0026B39371
MLKALLADDEMLDLEGMKQFIPWSELGIEVVDAMNNGFSACDVMEQEQIDILVTDVHMPNMTGLELAKRAMEVNKDIRIIFVSGYQDFNYVKQALSLNACSYVLKPMDDEELVESLRKVTVELYDEKQRREAEQDYLHMIPMAKNELLHSKANSKNSKLIREIIKVMKERMHENLTLKDIAYQFSFSPNYLGRLFKEDVGKTFSEVLVQLRMDAARAMLDDPR